MIEKTKSYTMFKVRTDNREKGIDQKHVDRLKESIQNRNMLELRPILVNANNEVIDGQHRLEAAKQLGLAIWYKVDKSLVATDMILLNNNKSWNLSDHFHFFIKNNYEHYKKLNDFIKQKNISLKIALTIFQKNIDYTKFKKGEFKFEETQNADIYFLCKQTIDLIKKLSTNSIFINGAKFWGAMVALFKEPNFNAEIWFDNLNKLIYRIGVKPSKREYILSFLDIHNYRNNDKILIDKVPEK